MQLFGMKLRRSNTKLIMEVGHIVARWSSTGNHRGGPPCYFASHTNREPRFFTRLSGSRVAANTIEIVSFYRMDLSGHCAIANGLSIFDCWHLCSERVEYFQRRPGYRSGSMNFETLTAQVVESLCREAV